MAQYDAIVIGLGAAGSAAADHLARRGARVLGLEQFTPAHDRGSSHGETRIIRTAYFEDPAYVPLVQRAFELWEDLERRSGRKLLTFTGALMLGRPESEVVRGTLESVRRWDLPHEELDAVEVRRRFPAFAVPEGAVAVYEKRAGVVNPELGVTAALDSAREAGAELRFEERVAGWDAGDAGVEVRTSEGRYRASRLVIAGGAWNPALLEGLLPLQVERQVMHWFLPDGDIAPYLPERMPVFLWERPDGAQFYGFPALDGEAVKFCRHHGGETTTADAVDRSIRPEDVAHVEEARAVLLPGLKPGAARSKVCMYTNTPDLNFCLGLHPAFSRVAVAAGLSGHGFKFAPTLGEIMADLALDGGTRHPIEPFRLDRFAK